MLWRRSSLRCTSGGVGSGGCGSGRSPGTRPDQPVRRRLEHHARGAQSGVYWPRGEGGRGKPTVMFLNRGGVRSPPGRQAGGAARCPSWWAAPLRTGHSHPARRGNRVTGTVHRQGCRRAAPGLGACDAREATHREAVGCSTASRSAWGIDEGSSESMWSVAEGAMTMSPTGTTV